MSFSKIYSGQSDIDKTTIVDIESDISRGLYSFSVVGLPDKAVEESRDRVGAAIKNSGYESPKSKNHKIVISLAPADLKKEGPAFDLPISLSYLLASGDIIFNPEKKLFLGELALDGKVRPVNGILPIVKKARDCGFEEVYVPKQNTSEAGLVRDIKIFGISSLKEVIDHLDESKKEFPQIKLSPIKETMVLKSDFENITDMRDIKGQDAAKRAMEIAAAGGHNILMFGPPGTGKTMLSKAFVSILPELDYDEIIEATSIHSIAGTLNEHYIATPPFRSPHHTSSHVAIVGGGAHLRPGEITLAHKGVLFLDEFPEFDRRVIESLREPLEEKMIKISRAKGTATFPADFILIAAMNPCPCGNFGSNKRCICRQNDIVRYQRKISGPILDRIDMWIEVKEIDHNILNNQSIGESSNQVRDRVKSARKIQKNRFRSLNINCHKNSGIKAKYINKTALLNRESLGLLTSSATKLSLSPRAYHRVIRIARTIADLDNSAEIKPAHILEALQYRQKRLY